MIGQDSESGKQVKQRLISTKFAKDYRWDVEPGKKGKMKNKMVYIGPLFEWDMEPDRLKSVRTRFLACELLSVILFVVSLWNYSSLTRHWYIAVPYACLLLVFCLMSASCYYLFTAKGMFRREQKEKTVDRIKGGGVAGAVLAAISLIAALITAGVIHPELGKWDYLFLGAAFLLIVLSLYSVSLGRELKVREQRNPEAVVQPEDRRPESK